MRLDIGAGPASDCDIQLDMVKWNDKIIVHDIVNAPWPVESESIDEVRAEQVLEHIPAVAYFPGPDGKMTHVYPRVIVMKEIFRVLKRGGKVHISVPVTDAEFQQDPTHTGPRWVEGTFNYFCGEWGGGDPGSFTNDAYGIDFKFRKLEAYMTGFILTIKLEKP